LHRVLLNNHKLSANSLNNLILESVDPNLRQDVTQILYRTYQHQKMIWDYMSSKGYYQVETAPQQEIMQRHSSSFSRVCNKIVKSRILG
jgi:spore coat protein F